MDVKDTTCIMQNHAHNGHSLKDVVIIANNGERKYKDFKIKFNHEKDRVEIHINDER